jgi:hypothetical protein
VFGAPNSWVRSSKSFGIQRTYNGGRPKDPARFLAVIWQINVLRRGVNIDPKLERTVRLQVEAPRYHENAILNQIKRELITSLMESELRQVASEVGYTPDESRINTSAEQVRTKRTITVFKTLLNQNQLRPTPEATVEAVHNELGWIIDNVVQGFESDLTEVLQQRGATRAPKIVTKDKKETCAATSGNNNAQLGQACCLSSSSKSAQGLPRLPKPGAARARPNQCVRNKSWPLGLQLHRSLFTMARKPKWRIDGCCARLREC